MKFELDPNVWNHKKAQDIYQTNIDFEASCEKVASLNSNLWRFTFSGGRPPAESHIIVSVDKDWKEGLKDLENYFIRLGTHPSDASAHVKNLFKNNRRPRKQSIIKAIISRYGKVQISYFKVDHRDFCVKFLKENLVSLQDEEIHFKPLSLNPFKQEFYLDKRKEIMKLFEEFTERSLTHEEVLKTSLSLLEDLTRAVIAECTERMIAEERDSEQLFSECLAMMQGFVFELVGEIMLYSYHVEMKNQ